MFVYVNVCAYAIICKHEFAYVRIPSIMCQRHQVWTKISTCVCMLVCSNVHVYTASRTCARFLDLCALFCDSWTTQTAGTVWHVLCSVWTWLCVFAVFWDHITDSIICSRSLAIIYMCVAHNYATITATYIVWFQVRVFVLAHARLNTGICNLLFFHNYEHLWVFNLTASSRMHTHTYL